MSSTATITSTDGVRLAVYERGDPAAPLLVCVHGFPDDHHAWGGLVQSLVPRWRVITYDARGTGRSDRPNYVDAYRLDRLAADLTAVIDHAGNGLPAHVVAHDWGSITAWHAATDPASADRMASLTSISGPQLDAMPTWFRHCRAGGRQGWRALARMWKTPIYMGLFQLPGISTMLCRSGAVDLSIALSERVEHGRRPHGLSQRRARQNWQSVKMYRANVAQHALHPRAGRTDIPVQVLAPRRDLFVTVDAQSAAARFVAPRAQAHTVEGGHWAPVFNPVDIASRVDEFVAHHADLREKDS